MAVLNGQTTALEMKMRLREKPLSELMEELEKLSSTSDCDVDLLCAYLDVLEEKAPVLPAGYDPSAEYEKFRENHAELFDAPERKAAGCPAPRKSRRLQLKRLLVTFAAVFCLLVLIAEASGAGVIGRFIEWSSETFSMRPASGTMELSTEDENGFRSLQDALDSYGVEDAPIPTWIPSRYSIDTVSIIETSDSTIISGIYASDDDELLIRTIIGSKETFTFEENQVDEHTVYEANGISFILSANVDAQRTTWYINGNTYSASGNITESELKAMLDSIQMKE